MLPKTLTVAAIVVTFSGAASALTLPPKVASHANDPAIHAGYLDATLYGADPTGKTDSTAAIQAAIDDGMKYAMATYLPSGTYLVSNTLLGQATFSNSGVTNTNIGTPTSFQQTPSLVGPASGPRPVLKLAASATGFGSASSPKPVIHFLDYGGCGGQPQCLGWAGNAASFFGAVIRDIDIDLGGNAGAIGIQFAAAQDSYIENVTVTATGAYAGIEGVPGRSETTANIEVDGGEYGLIPATGAGMTLVGIVLKNQTKAGLVLDAFAATTVTGFDIEETGSAIPISISAATYQGVAETVLVDGLLVGTGTAIDNQYGHNLYAANVWVRTSSSGALVQSGKQAAVAASGKTDVLRLYSYTDTSVLTFLGVTTTSYNLIDGKLSQSEIVTASRNVGSAPADLVVRHLPGALPWFADPGVIDPTTLGAKGDGVTDDTAAIESALAKGPVFLPRGDYVISKTLVLGQKGKLFGVPGPRSRLFAPGWDPGGVFQPFVQTVDSATATSYLGDIQMFLPTSDSSSGLGKTYLSCLDWRAGRSSVVRQLVCQPTYDVQSASEARKLILVEGNGGGRWYGTMLQQIGSRLQNPDLRGLLVEGTTQPLTFYGLNPEHPMALPFVQIDKASNVRVFGSKSEDSNYLISGSHNVLFAGHTGNNDSDPLMSVIESSNVELPVFSEFAGYGSPSGSIVYASPDGKTGVSIAGNDRCSYFAWGTFDASGFPACGDGVCDGAESSENCPSDCGADVAATAGDDGGVSQGAPTSTPTSPASTPASGCACTVTGRHDRTSYLGAVALGLLFLARRRRTA